VQLLLVNMDVKSTVYVGDSAVQAGDGTSIIIQPLSSMAIPATGGLYAINDSTSEPDTTVLQVIQGGSDWNASPAQVAQSIDIVALAVAIAQAISQSGVPLLSAPVPLYSISSQGPSGGGTPGVFGSTFAGAYPSQPVADQQPVTFNTNVGRTATAGKYFPGPQNFPTVPDQHVQTYIDNNMSCYICYIPSYTKGGSGGYKASETTAMIASANALHAAGLKIAGLILWNEAEDGVNQLSGPTYVAGMAFHYSGLHIAGYRVISCHAGFQINQLAAYDPFPNCDAYLVDFYGNDYLNGGRIDPLFALGQTRSLPAGVGEFNTANAKATLSVADGTNYLNYIYGLALAQLQAGFALEAFMWWWDDSAKSGNLSGPILSPGDFRVPLLQKINDTVTTTSSSSPASINPGTTATLGPLTPSVVNPVYSLANAISYDAMFKLVAGVGSTNPFAKISFNWLNETVATGNPVRKQSYIVPMGVSTSNGTRLTVVGPQSGQYLSVTITNLDTVACTYQAFIDSTSRPVNKHDPRWETNGSVNVPGFTLAKDSDDSVLYNAVAGQNVGIGATKSWLFPVFAGQAFMNLKVNGAAGTNTVHFTLGPVPSSEFSTAEEFSAYLPAGGGVTQNEAFYTIALPRGPMLLTVNNNDTNAVTVTAVIVPIE
jgi:hypothetical protein